MQKTIRCGRCGKDAQFNTSVYRVDGHYYIYRCGSCLWQGEVRQG